MCIIGQINRTSRNFINMLHIDNVGAMAADKIIRQIIHDLSKRCILTEQIIRGQNIDIVQTAAKR